MPTSPHFTTASSALARQVIFHGRDGGAIITFITAARLCAHAAAQLRAPQPAACPMRAGAALLPTLPPYRRHACAARSMRREASPTPLISRFHDDFAQLATPLMRFWA